MDEAIREEIIVVAGHAIDEEIIDRHPMKKIKKREEPEGRARYLKMKGVDLYSIQTLLGILSDIKMTQIYAKLSPDYLRSAVSQLGG